MQSGWYQAFKDVAMQRLYTAFPTRASLRWLAVRRGGICLTPLAIIPAYVIVESGVLVVLEETGGVRASRCHRHHSSPFLHL